MLHFLKIDNYRLVYIGSSNMFRLDYTILREHPVLRKTDGTGVLSVTLVFSFVFYTLHQLLIFENVKLKCFNINCDWCTRWNSKNK
jgi:hypothetical protein